MKQVYMLDICCLIKSGNFKGLSLLKGFRLKNIKNQHQKIILLFMKRMKNMKKLTWTKPVNIDEGENVYLLLIRWLKIRNINIVTTVKTTALYLSLDLVWCCTQLSRKPSCCVPIHPCRIRHEFYLWQCGGLWCGIETFSLSNATAGKYVGQKLLALHVRIPACQMATLNHSLESPWSNFWTPTMHWDFSLLVDLFV